ncbi:BgtTE-56040 [Blumeria graminis f. sp. tritici]|uniref:BgtTE-56040 n=1 Tax=Blumeria graminis f. sp. tritici TaxID=62690 RepID=A0A9X9MGB3_BLUGR|nr:BgtTE-56040 [Blumeria graminis f. sp. tritici]
MTLLTLETLILWISFANTTMRYVRLHKQSTLLRKYPPEGRFKTFGYPSNCPCFIQAYKEICLD